MSMYRIVSFEATYFGATLGSNEKVAIELMDLISSTEVILLAKGLDPIPLLWLLVGQGSPMLMDLHPCHQQAGLHHTVY